MMDAGNQKSDAAKLHRLIDELCDASISSEGMQELNKRLEADAFSRSEYLNHITLEAGLCSLFLKTDHADTKGALSKKTLPGRKAWSFPSLFALAASIALVAFGSSWLTYEAIKGRGMLAGPVARDADVPSEGIGPLVARITGTRNCVWAPRSSAIGYGSALMADQLLELKTGLAEITFAGGTRIVLEGPSSLRVPDADSVELTAGRMAASVPPGNSDFAVSTPRLTIHEAGAQFGVVASANGLSEVHVFEGSVRAALTNDRGQTIRRVELADRNAARLGPTSADVTFISVNEGSFVRTLASSAGPGAGLLAVEEFDYPLGPLAWQNGGFGWAGPWADIEVDDEAMEAGAAAESNGVAMGSLTFRGGLALGNHASQTGQANRIRRALGTSIGGVFDAAELVENQDGVRLIGRDGHTVYLSFLQRVSKADDVFYGFELHRGDGNFNRVFCIGNGAESSGYGVTSNFNAYVGEKYEKLDEENTDTNYFIVRIEFGEKNRDIVTVYRNPEQVADESQCDVSATLRGNFAFDRVSLANFKGQKVHEVDEIRVGTSFRAVTAERGQLDTPLASVNHAERLRLPELQTRKMKNPGALYTLLLGKVRFLSE